MQDKNCQKGVKESEDYLDGLKKIDKKWDILGFVFSILFILPGLFSMISGCSNKEIRKSENDYEFKIYYGNFIFPCI